MTHSTQLLRFLQKPALWKVRIALRRARMAVRESDVAQAVLIALPLSLLGWGVLILLLVL